jgi:AraC family transcriptional regulator, arabinose operon regulatory protein
MLTPDGFPGERLRVLPRPLVARALAEGVTTRLLVTDAGHFPHAVSHGRLRPRGAREAVVIVCVEGLGWCEASGQVVPVPAGSALVIPPGLAHLYRADTGSPWTIWWLHCAGADLGVLLEALQATDEIRVIEIGDMFRVTAIAEHVIGCMERDETWPSLIEAAGSAWSLLAQLAADRVAGNRRQHEPIRDAQDHLRENYTSPVSVPDLARLAGLSTSHFSALFRSATGGGVLDYVKSLRMARARELLLTSTRSVSQISTDVGYTDAFYFSRQFRALNGCSPSAYRRQKDELIL